MCVMLCFMGFHKWKLTDCIEYQKVSRHKRKMYRVMKCKRCCSKKRGEEFFGETYKGGNACNIIEE